MKNVFRNDYPQICFHSEWNNKYFLIINFAKFSSLLSLPSQKR